MSPTTTASSTTTSSPVIQPRRPTKVCTISCSRHNHPKQGLPSAATHGNFSTNVSGNWDGQALLDQVSMEIAVNPTNPDNLVIATSSVDEVSGRSYVDVYWSNDGGHTWMRTAIDDTVDGGWDPANPDNREDADVTFDQYGNAYISYRAYDQVTHRQWIMVGAAGRTGTRSPAQRLVWRPETARKMSLWSIPAIPLPAESTTTTRVWPSVPTLTIRTR